MEIIGDDGLGAPRFELGRIREADRPSATTALRIVALLIGIGIIVVGIVFILMWLFRDTGEGARAIGHAVIAFGIGGLCIVGGAAIILACVLAGVMTNRLNVSVYDGGVVIVHKWFRRSQIAWSQVATITPPEPAGAASTCMFILHSGRRVLVERLCLPSLRDHTGTVVPHYDVRLVIDEFLRWRRDHGGA